MIFEIKMYVSCLLNPFITNIYSGLFTLCLHSTSFFLFKTSITFPHFVYTLRNLNANVAFYLGLSFYSISATAQPF